MIAAVFIVSHGIMGRIQEEFTDMGFREELPHGEIVVQKAMGNIRRKPWLRTEGRITILHKLIDRRKVEVPELLHDFPGVGIKGSISIWIILTELSQDTVLIGGMTANINRFQNVHLQSRANLFLD